MKLNMGIVDRCIRAGLVAPGLVLSSWIVFGFGSVVGIVFLVFAGLILVTAAVGYCPNYVPLGINTNRRAVTTNRKGAAFGTKQLTHTG